ncbi:vWA domain-containing protein [Desulfofundulus thermosubterraneus]|uniref:von Willebrand factor type A domain-containing protein n=1 Tax=Desulfofundulus thermosubterraneus DSM 16057 TaxID=1121432 RepID=A0A1M6ALW2_9FIRM|nr:BatA and WFA domain-containing protein [Desulfofundulus thermosubterraneus]SHI37421.1 von Willebrand factor type A domain-containing protein [Desulfofundulus thermosubterraneus DSM 16057]
MSFFHPLFLWLGLTLPAIVALYILRPRRREMIVPSTLFWQAAPSSMEASRPWQRLKPRLLLWLQLLVAASLTLGAAAPVWYRGSPSKSVIILLDASASMNATDLGQTRFSRALREVEAMANGLEKGAAMTVIAFDQQPRVVVREAADSRQVHRALQGLKPSCYPGELGPALSLARALGRQQDRPRIVLVSDGGLAPVDNAGDLELVTVGKDEAANVALAGLQLRPAGEGQAAQVTVVNHGRRAASGRVYLSAGRQEMQARKWRLEPGESTHLLWPHLPAGVPVAARLAVDDVGMDHLALDNQAWAVPENKHRVRVLLVSQGNIFLERALGVLPGVEVYKCTPQEYTSLLGGAYNYEITVLDGLISPLPPGAALFVNPPAGEVAGLKIGGRFHPPALAGTEGSIMLRYVDLSQVHIASARALETGSGWTADVNAAGKTVMAHGQRQGKRLVAWGFDLHESDLPLRPAFPVLLHNAISWLAPPDLELPAQVYPGQEVNVAALPLARKIEVEPVSPEAVFLRGASLSSVPNENNLDDGKPGVPVVLAPPFPPAPWIPSAPGLYRIVESCGDGDYPGNQISRLVAVNGYHARESDLRVRDPRSRQGEEVTSTAPRPRPQSLAGLLSALALAAVLVEWGVASRGR